MKNNSEIKILIVDDEYAIAFSLTSYLEDEGFDVIAVSSSQEALAHLEKENFHMGIVDLNLAGINGEEFIEKAFRMNPLMRFLLQTGTTDYRLPAHLLNCGMSQEDVVIKPPQSLAIFTDKIHNVF